MAGNFRKCKDCGKIFNFMGKSICPDCIKKRDEDFAKVRKYIYENPNARAEEIAEATEVDIKEILEFLKEGRLQLKHADGLLKCEKCGAPIATGTLCDRCTNSLNSHLRSALPQKEDKKPKSRLEMLESMKSKLHVDINDKK